VSLAFEQPQVSLIQEYKTVWGYGTTVIILSDVDKYILIVKYYSRKTKTTQKKSLCRQLRLASATHYDNSSYYHRRKNLLLSNNTTYCTTTDC